MAESLRTRLKRYARASDRRNYDNDGESKIELDLPRKQASPPGSISAGPAGPQRVARERQRQGGRQGVRNGRGEAEIEGQREKRITRIHNTRVYTNTERRLGVAAKGQGEKTGRR